METAGCGLGVVCMVVMECYAVAILRYAALCCDEL